MKLSIVTILLTLAVPAEAVQQIDLPDAEAWSGWDVGLAALDRGAGYLAQSPVEREFGEAGTPVPGPIVDPDTGTGLPNAAIVPEPEAWILFTIGLGGLGFALRRQRDLVASVDEGRSRLRPRRHRFKPAF